MKNQNNLKTQNSKLVRLRRLAINLIGVWIVLCVVLGCSFSEFKLGEKKTSRNSSTRDSETGSVENLPLRDENLPLKERIIGKWQGMRSGKKITMEFTSDELTMNMGGKSKPARYKVLDEETIALADGGDENYNEKLKVKFSGGKMTISDASGKDPVEFTRTDGNDSSKESNNANSSSNESSSLTDSTDSREDRNLINTLDVLSQQFARADMMADRTELERILADDYIMNLNGKDYTKEEFIKNAKRDTSWVSAQSKDSRLITKEENRVVLEHKLIIKYTDETQEFDCRSEFVKSGSWQIRSRKIIK